MELENTSSMNNTPDSTAARAFSAPPHLVDDSGAMIAWFIEPAGVLLQFARSVRGTTPMAEWLVGTGFDRLVQRFPGQRNLRVILDMREMTGRSASARAVLIANVIRLRPRIGHVVLLPSRHMGGDYLGIVELAVRMVNAMGLRVEIEHDLDRLLARHATRVASARAPESEAAARS